MNTAIISGRLVRDPGYNETQNEKGLHKIAKFVLAVRRNYSDDVSFIPVKAFAKKAEFVRDYLVQGTKVMVEGEIVTGSYDNKETGKGIYDRTFCRPYRVCRCKSTGESAGADGRGWFSEHPGIYGRRNAVSIGG